MRDPEHDWHGTHEQYNNGVMDGFVRTNNPDGRHAMGYLDQGDLPFYYSLATTFAIGDRYFASVLGPTWPNRLYFIVKAITQSSADTSMWAVIAMAKHGGDCNREGARNWEFFTLRMQGANVSIVERGLAPRTDGDGDPYGVTAGITCNTCHGTADARMVDSILTPELRPADAGL